MFKYTKYIFVALMVSGLLAISYGGCGGGSDDTGSTPNPTPSPTDNDTVPTDPPPTNPPGACEGDAFTGTAQASTQGVDGCLTEFILQNAETSSLSCFCSASEAGNFILTISPTFESFMKLNIEFPENTNPDVIAITTFTFDWTAPNCDTLELFTSPLFSDNDLISIGTFDDMNETIPDQLSFKANVSDALLSTLFGSSGQMVSCDFCSIDNLPACAPNL